MSKAVEPVVSEPMAVLRAIVPILDEHVEPWDSVVHWPELFIQKDDGKNRGYTKWVVPVTCGRRASPDCRGKRDVIVLRGMNGTEMLTPECLTGRGSIYSGVCMPCLKVKDYPVLAPSSYVCLGDDNEEGTLVKCGGCGRTRRCRIKEPNKFTGLCSSCAVRKAFDSKTVSEGPNKGKIPFNCAECGGEFFAWPHQHKSPKWKKLCPEHQKWNGVSLIGGLNRLNEDTYLPLTKAPVFLSRRHGKDGKLVPTQCVFPIPDNENKICGVVHDLHFKVLRRNWNDATGYCPEHAISGQFSGRAAYELIATLQAQTQTSDRQEKGSAETSSIESLPLEKDSVLPLGNAKKLIDEITPRIVEAKKLARKSISKDWRAKVSADFPELTHEAISMLPSAKPSECAVEQIARQHYGCSSSTLKRKLREYRDHQT